MTGKNPDGGGGRQGRPKSDLGRNVARLANSVFKGIADDVADYGLSPFDVHLLMICLETEESTATELARLLPIDASRISRLVNVLVEKDLLVRRRRRQDRRIVMLRLSPEGQDLASTVARRMEALYARLTMGLTESEIRQFSATALKIQANYEAMEEDRRA